jgi:hypothetical protein
MGTFGSVTTAGGYVITASSDAITVSDPDGHTCTVIDARVNGGDAKPWDMTGNTVYLPDGTRLRSGTESPADPQILDLSVTDGRDEVSVNWPEHGHVLRGSAKAEDLPFADVVNQIVADVDQAKRALEDAAR